MKPESEKTSASQDDDVVQTTDVTQDAEVAQETAVSAEAMISQDSKNIALLVWVGSIFLGFIPSLIAYLVKKDDEFITAHAKEALNLAITVTIAYIACTILSFIVIGALLMPVVGICNLIFCIIAATKAAKAEYYKAPIAIRLIK